MLLDCKLPLFLVVCIAACFATSRFSMGGGQAQPINLDGAKGETRLKAFALCLNFNANNRKLVKFMLFTVNLKWKAAKSSMQPIVYLPLAQGDKFFYWSHKIILSLCNYIKVHHILYGDSRDEK
ncbi:hypothetical protein ACJX0J_013285, partial [Zea mays]